MKSFNNFLNEKVGVNKSVEDFSNDINNFIISKIKNKKLNKENHFYFPVNEIPSDIVNNKNVNYFKIIIYTTPWYASNMTISLEDNNISIIFKISPDYDNRIKLSTIIHEIKHLYQFTRNINKNHQINTDKNTDLYYKLKDIKSYYKNNKFRIFNTLIYLSTKYEIDARVQETYKILKDNKTTKDNFLENLKKTDNYVLSQYLLDCEIINKIKKEDPVKFVSHWLFMYENINYLNKDSEIKGYLKFFYNISFSKLIDLYLKYFGPIKKPKIVKKYPILNINTFFYNEVSKEYADIFLNKWERIFKKQGKKFKNKLTKLYDKF